MTDKETILEDLRQNSYTPPVKLGALSLKVQCTIPFNFPAFFDCCFCICRPETILIQTSSLASEDLGEEETANANENYQSPLLWCSVQAGNRTGTPGVQRVLGSCVVEDPPLLATQQAVESMVQQSPLAAAAAEPVVVMVPQPCSSDVPVCSENLMGGASENGDQGAGDVAVDEDVTSFGNNTATDLGLHQTEVVQSAEEDVSAEDSAAEEDITGFDNDTASNLELDQAEDVHIEDDQHRVVNQHTHSSELLIAVSLKWMLEGRRRNSRWGTPQYLFENYGFALMQWSVYIVYTVLGDVSVETLGSWQFSDISITRNIDGVAEQVSRQVSLKMGEIEDHDAYEEELLDYEEEDEKAPDSVSAKAADSAKKGYVGIHGSGFRDFLLKPELLRAIVDSGFEHPSEGKVSKLMSDFNISTILGMDQAKSGMGKTAVFVLQIEPVAALVVLCHTRELAYQVIALQHYIKLSELDALDFNKVVIFVKSS
ncbi:hypothetical protein V6N11_080992 [Hibiscus sabdariffa]|uniref:DEAD-box RNA helicase Q domain-containing protein n=1 Tax=Hibiscus sabdariffa TaxID=183260 RepID=A0ABR2QIN1_9ROSI